MFLPKLNSILLHLQTDVTVSVNKLLNMICTHSNTLSQQEVYIHSFGVATDPLAQLAIVVSALIHDVDHRGVPNPVLAKEDPSMAQRYEGKSIAEQNSVEMAWEILMRPTFRDFRACLFPTTTDLARFRQLVSHTLSRYLNQFRGSVSNRHRFNSIFSRLSMP
jgi:hypothetical protein